MTDANRLFLLRRAERSLARGVRQAPLSLGRDWDAGYAWWQENGHGCPVPLQFGAVRLGVGFGGDGSGGGAYG